MPGLATLLPAAVVVAHCRGDELPDGDLGLYPGEESTVARAVDKRRREFVVARACARQALRRLGAPAGAIPKGPAGEPLWPPGVVGSITHCAGYTGAAVAHHTEVLTIGVDAEPNEPLPDGVLRLTAGAGESDQLDSLAAHDPAVHWGRLLFCAKEALFKAWYPVQQQWLGFADASIRLDPGGTFRARLITPTPGAGRFADCPGRWTLDGGVLLTALWLPAGA